jgi:hypothetical protein
MVSHMAVIYALGLPIGEKSRPLDELCCSMHGRADGIQN